MRKKEFSYSCYSARIILLVGESEELLNYLERLERRRRGIRNNYEM